MLLLSDAPAVGRTIGELELPKEIVIAAIARGKRMISPRGGGRFEADDHVCPSATEAGEDPIPGAFRPRPAADDDAPARAALSDGWNAASVPPRGLRASSR